VPDWFQEWKFILVIAILGVSALMASNKNKLPLALRGLKKVLESQNGEKKDSSLSRSKVSPIRRFFAFLLVIVAFIIAII
jgi:hypothetical protein